jgi:hypothetical protein
MEDWVTIRNLKVKNPNLGTITVAKYNHPSPVGM